MVPYIAVYPSCQVFYTRYLIVYVFLAHLLVVHLAYCSAVQNQGEESGEDTSWPGRDFALKEYLPGSVYLWAGGERDDEEDQAPSASDAVVGWAVLLVSNLCLTSYSII